MNDLLIRREKLSLQGVEIFILPAQNSRYSVEVYEFKNSIFPILELYMEGDDFSQLLSNAIDRAEEYLKRN